jgi:hypothetical protein
MSAPAGGVVPKAPDRPVVPSGDRGTSRGVALPEVDGDADAQVPVQTLDVGDVGGHRVM